MLKEADIKSNERIAAMQVSARNSKQNTWQIYKSVV
jgi:hypothetical protein